MRGKLTANIPFSSNSWASSQRSPLVQIFPGLFYPSKNETPRAKKPREFFTSLIITEVPHIIFLFPILYIASFAAVALYSPYRYYLTSKLEFRTPGVCVSGPFETRVGKGRLGTKAKLPPFWYMVHRLMRILLLFIDA